MPLIRYFFLGFLAGLRVNMGLCPVADFRFLRKGKGILLIEKLPQDALDLLIGKILIGRSEIAHQDIGVMLDCADVIAVLVITGPVCLHTVYFHLQVCFPLGIDKLRVVDVLVLRQIGRGGDTSQAPGPDIGKRGKQRRNEKYHQKQKDENAADNRVALDGVYHRGSDLFRCNGCVLCPLSGFLCLPCGFGILPFQLLLLPHPGKEIFL